MITKIQIKNFKKFKEVEVELGERVVFIGPNNSGKTTCLQALSLWHLGLLTWMEKKWGKKISKRTAVALNRKDLMNIPLPETIQLWHQKRVRKSEYTQGKLSIENIKIQIIVEFVSLGQVWNIGLEFDYANSESVYCRPIGNFDLPNDVFDKLRQLKIAFLQPMSGLASIEAKLESGRINVLLGEGQTAQVLRNLCYNIYIHSPEKWNQLNEKMHLLFGAKLKSPQHIASRGEVTLSYIENDHTELDISSAGRGFLQTLLLLSYLYSHPHSIILLDEPDAHLEILRQQQIYHLLSEISSEQQSQIIISSHSEVLLNEAGDRDLLMAFVGKPHRIDDRSSKSQVLKSLKEIGFEQYYLAEQNGWVLYVEGSTDLAILKKLAEKLNHPAKHYLARPFVHYVLNQPNLAEKHFYGLKEAKENLVGIAIYDQLKTLPASNESLVQTCWRKREIENYFTNEESLIRYAKSGLTYDLFGTEQAARRENSMRQAIEKVSSALEILRKPHPWSDQIKITDEFLDKVFELYFEELELPNQMKKTDYHMLIDFFDTEKLDEEITEKLNAIVEVAKKAQPETDFH